MSVRPDWKKKVFARKVVTKLTGRVHLYRFGGGCGGGWFLAFLAVGTPVVGVVFLPTLTGSPLVVDVVRIGRHFFPQPRFFSGRLAIGLTAILLVLDTRVRRQRAVTMLAPEGFHGFAIPDVVGRHGLIITGKNHSAP